MMTTLPPPSLFRLGVGALGYAASGRLLRHTSLRSARALRNTTVAFLADAGISLEVTREQDRTALFSNVGRGYGTKPAPIRSTRDDMPPERPVSVPSCTDATLDRIAVSDPSARGARGMW